MSTADDALYSRVRSDRDSRPERPVEALELSMRYLDWMRTTDYDLTAQALSKYLAKRLHHSLPGGYEEYAIVSPDYIIDGAITPSISCAMNGVTQFVSKDMTRLLLDLASSMPTDMLFPTDIMFPDGGLIVFSSPISVPSGDDRVPDTLVSALGISPSVTPIVVSDGSLRDGVMISIFSRPGDIEEWMGDFFIDGFRIRNGSPLGTAPLVLSDLIAWTYGTPWYVGEDESRPSYKGASPKIDFIRRFLLSYFRLLWQEVLDAEIVPLPRPVRRRLDRLSPAGRESGDVLRVVRLRKVYEEFDSPEDRVGSGSSFKHGFMRRGHWRRIRQGTDGERVVYVRAHLVRPDLPRIDSWVVASVER